MNVKDCPGRYLVAALLLTGTCTHASWAQDIASIAKSDPLIITGAVGTQNTFYWTSQGQGYSSPFSNSVYANLNFNIYGITMPFSFYYTNDNASFSLPRISFNISPTYKGWTLHLGERSMPFSSYTFTMPFNGVGLEYRASRGASFRFGAFYGTLKKAYNVEPDYISVRSPQYKRTGYGLKVGYGTSRTYLDLYLFRAKDHLSSIDEIWYDKLNPQENIVIGAKARVSMGSHLGLTANVATSLFSTDIRTRKVDVEEATKYENIFDIRYSSLVRWAGDVSLNSSWKHFSISLNSKIIQPDYTSLGVSYITNNYYSIGTSVSTSIKRLSLAGSFNYQADNLSGDQLFTTCGNVYSATATLPIGQKFVLSASYNGYLQNQKDGTEHINDTTVVKRRMDSYSFSPSFNHSGELASHNISVSSNYTVNKDLNKFSTGESDVNTLAVGANYALTWNPIETTFSGNVSYQNSDGFNTKYSTTIYSLSASRSFLEEKNLSLSASVSLTNNRITGSDSNLSLGGYISASYTLATVHQFSLSGSTNSYSSVNQTESGHQKYSSYTCSLNYGYTFTAFHIKRQAAKKGEPNNGKKYTIYSDFSRKLRQEQKAKEKAQAEQRSQSQTEQQQKRNAKRY